MQNTCQDYIDEECIDVWYQNLSESVPAMAFKDEKVILIYDKLSETEKKWAILHEIGHFATDSFYTLKTPIQNWAWLEGKVKRWVIFNFVPVENIKPLLAAGYRTCWELAEELDVPEKIIHDAIDLYSRRGLL